MSSLVNRNVVVAGRRTSVRLEPQMWDAFAEIALSEGRTVNEICTDVARFRRESTLTAGLRVFILQYFREAATPEGHRRAGHGLRGDYDSALQTAAIGAPRRRARG